ncbi:response regulator [Nocardioides jishulii]|uniref:Response regulator transcription factor n=1 Tax=Nocardioides jishulii TaxID=2575440 RepID=A0A4U2YTY8_9ACTN|nr:response regulator transcription factor [Nocardioides jishulii]QCX28563.1 response regulator transcription factor [Nocardioides jishulii]TKI64544.1 response regulator transcription factor [Nocardioides jishulii]
MQKIRVFLLDDHEIVRRGLRHLLEAEDDMTVVGEAGTVRDGRRGVLEQRPDVALLDARLPDGSGVEVARGIQDVAPEVRTMILSSFDDEETLVAAFSAGVSGYVLKQIEADSLLKGIREVASGKSLVAPAVASRMMERMRQRRESGAGALPDLTPQERRILQLIGDGLTNRQIGDRLFLSEKTIKNNVTPLLAKLGVQRRAQAALLAAHLLD